MTRLTISFLTLVFVLTFGCQRTARPEKFLIPYGRIGSIVIVHRQTNGLEERTDGSRLVYAIPRTGSLITQTALNDGFLNQEYYYVDSFGQERRILLDSSRLYYNDPAMATRFKTQHAKDTLIMQWGISGIKNAKRYQEFVIGTYQSPNSIDTAFSDNE